MFLKMSSRLFASPVVCFDAETGGSGSGSSGGSGDNGGAAGGTTGSGSSGESQKPSTGTGASSQSNTSTDQLIAQLSKLQQDFDAYKKTANGDLAKSRKQLQKLLKQAGGGGEEGEDEDGEKTGESSPENVLALTQAAQEKDRQIADLGNQIVTLRKQIEVERQARDQGFLHPEDAVPLVNLAALKVDEKTGVISGVKEALEALKTKYPALVSGKKSGTLPPDDNGDRKTQKAGDDKDREQRLRQRFNIH